MNQVKYKQELCDSKYPLSLCSFYSCVKFILFNPVACHPFDFEWPRPINFSVKNMALFISMFPNLLLTLTDFWWSLAAELTLTSRTVSNWPPPVQVFNNLLRSNQGFGESIRLWNPTWLVSASLGRFITEPITKFPEGSACWTKGVAAWLSSRF